LNIPHPLIADIAQGRCLPFVGAGFSKNASLPIGLSMPDWAELTAVLARDAATPPGTGAQRRIVTRSLASRLAEVVRWRNKAVHEVEEPTKKAAHFVLATIHEALDSLPTAPEELALALSDREVRPTRKKQRAARK